MHRFDRMIQDIKVSCPIGARINNFGQEGIVLSWVFQEEDGRGLANCTVPTVLIQYVDGSLEELSREYVEHLIAHHPSHIPQ